MRGHVAVGIGHRRAQHQGAGRRAERGAVVGVARVGVVDRRQLVQRHVPGRGVDGDGEVVGAADAAGDHVAGLVQHDLRARRPAHAQGEQPGVDVGAAERQAVAGAAGAVGAVADGGVEVVGEVGRGVDRQVRLVHRQGVGRQHAGDDGAVILDRDSDCAVIGRVHTIRDPHRQAQAGNVFASRTLALQQVTDGLGQDHAIGYGAARSSDGRGSAIERHPDDFTTGIRADQHRLAGAVSPGEVGGAQHRRTRIDQFNRQRCATVAGDGQGTARVGGGISQIVAGAGAKSIRNTCRQAFFGNPGLGILYERDGVIVDDRASGDISCRVDRSPNGRRDRRHHRFVGLVETVDHRVRHEAHAQLPSGYRHLACRPRTQPRHRVIRALGRRPAQRDRHHGIRHRHPVQTDLIGQVDRAVFGHTRRRHCNRDYWYVIIDDLCHHAAGPDRPTHRIAQVDRVFLGAFDQGIVQRHH